MWHDVWGKNCRNFLGCPPGSKAWVVVPDYLKERGKQLASEKRQTLKTMFAQMSDADAVQKELIVVAYCMNPSVPFSTLENKYWRAAFQSSLRGIDGTTMNQEILKYAKSLDDSFFKLIKGSMVSLVFDGGKDISGHKLIASGIIWNKTAMLLEIMDTKLETLNEQFYQAYCTRIVSSVAAKGKCLVLAWTIDNEPVENAGLDAAIRTSLSHLLHFRCGPHTLTPLNCC